MSNTEAEAKTEAEEVQVQDGPDETGEMFMRPGKLSDYFPKPFANDAAAANSGAVPPDLSYIVLDRHGNEDYIYHLLNGYCDPPAGIELRDRQHFNHTILVELLAWLLPSTMRSSSTMMVHQLLFLNWQRMSPFLTWTASPEHDMRKKMSIKGLGMLTILAGLSYYMKRHKWSLIKSRKIVYTPKVPSS